MDFVSFCRERGILIDSLPELGRWRRYKTEDKPAKRNGAVKWMGDHGFAQNHATMPKPDAWRSENDYKLNAIDEARLKRIREKELADRRAQQSRMRAYIAESRPLQAPQHAYLANKGLTMLGCQQLRRHGDTLVAPMQTATGSLVNVQRIEADGQKRFWPGQPVTGTFYSLRRARAPVTVFTEGLATGLAVYQCVRMASVVVCFNTGNLAAVFEALKPTGSVVIAADNDWKTALKEHMAGVNPGIAAAQAVAEKVGCGVVWPKDIEGSDYADAWREWGDGSERRIEREILGGARFVRSMAVAA
jgi:phage/plasmid primase-like uncharacterized protein